MGYGKRVASKKRRAARELVKGEGARAEAEAETLVPRKPSLMRKEVAERLRADPRFKRPDDDELEALRTRAQAVVLMDASGRRECDINNPDDFKYITVDRDVGVLARTDGVYGMPTNMRTGMISIRQEDVPDDLNTTRVLPLAGSAMKLFMRDTTNTFSDILMYTPLFPVPVFTPKLLNLLLLDTPVPPTENSFQLLKVYMTAMHLLRNADFTRKRATTAIEWLCARSEARSITYEDVARFAENVHFVEGVETAAARQAFVDAFDLAHTVEHTVRAFRSALPEIYTVDPYPGGDWAEEAGGVFVEDVMEDHRLTAQALCEKIGDLVEDSMLPRWEEGATDPDEIYAAVLGAVQVFTLRFLEIYETTIMRILSDASLIGPTIPPHYFDSLRTPARMPAADEVYETVMASVRVSRELFTDVRTKTMQLPIGVEHNAPREAAGGARGDCFPSATELHAYMLFVSYSAESEADFADSVQRMQDSLHITQPKEVIEGVHVAADEAEAEAWQAQDERDSVSEPLSFQGGGNYQ